MFSPAQLPGLQTLSLLVGLVLTCPQAGGETNTPETYRHWIEAMQQAERGPFSRIRWFCADGTVLPPEPYACRDHGGGRQHGEYSDRTRELRDNGYLIANILAALPPEQALAKEAGHLKWVLLERFLFATDNGWILRKARHYRGAFQSESEAAAARSIMAAMLSDARYRTTHFLLMREAARLLPWHAEFGSLDKVRALAGTIAENDPEFAPLRNKIHSFPEPDDIVAVRKFAADVDNPEEQEQLQSLIAALELSFQSSELIPGLQRLAATQGDTDTGKWTRLADDWRTATTHQQRLDVAARILVSTRESLNSLGNNQRLDAMALSLAAEQAAFAEGMPLFSGNETRTREWYLQRLKTILDVLYGIGFVTEREWRAQQQQLTELPQTPELAEYRDCLEYLSRVPAWADARLRFFFANPIRKFAEIEPLADGFISARLRSSSLLIHGHLLSTLRADADQLAGVRHQLFGRTVEMGLRSLNPGMARGPLRQLSDYLQENVVQGKPIIIASETIATLPPVAGILTAREGNALSHVQLLARNLGIPNIVVADELIADIEKHVGERVVLLSSPGGVVRLQKNTAAWNPVFSEEANRPVAINVDLDKLELNESDPVSLDDLRATDAGRIVGPKAAKLGELKTHFPDRVSAGLAIPFGTFRAQLERPYKPGGPSLLEWMREQYLRLDGIKLPDVRQREQAGFLREIRERIRNMELDPAFREQLKKRLRTVFGNDGSYGVFVRSDTNVEDLPGFTGAGLNLTVPNVIGFDNIIESIKAVWASPFTARAFSWRQALMTQPEHVYVSVLLHKTVPADKSGVMVTADVTNNQPGVFSIAVNEGVGGGVEGQAAETLKVDTDTRKVQLLATAAEPSKWILPDQGGISRAPASGAERVLSQAEIDQLVAFGKTLPQQYPALLDADGQPTPADVEFAFADDRLFLIQIRPFLQSKRAQRNRLLMEMDRELIETADRPVVLVQQPVRQSRYLIEQNRQENILQAEP